MKRSLGIGLSLAIVTPIILTAAVSWGASSDTGCWDEYNKRGTRMYRTVTPKGQDLEDCTPAADCKWGYAAKDGKRNRLYVPHGQDPATACADITTTTLPPITTTPPTPPVVPDAGGRFETLPVGADLPSEATCAEQVRSMTENRPENAAANATAGSGANTTYPRVTGNFTGTTDEILQWAACKWGIDEDWVRSQMIIESYWNQGTMGDFTTDADRCIPRFPIGDYPSQYNGDPEHTGECPESIGLGQVRWLHHQSAFDDDNAIDSTAYNVDYTYAIWRTCYEGGFPWLNDVPGRGDYGPGDAAGCLGVWYTGRWYHEAVADYLARFDDTLANRTWEQDSFGPAEPDGDVGTSTTLPPVVTTPPPSTVAPPVTAPPTTTPATTTPVTTTPVTTTPPTTDAPDPVPAGELLPVYQPRPDCAEGDVVPLGQAAQAANFEPLGSIWCFDLAQPPARTATEGSNSWVDDFTVGCPVETPAGCTSMMSLDDGDMGYRTFDRTGNSPPEQGEHWINQNHWMTDVQGGFTGGSSLSPNRSFQFENGAIVVEGEFAASLPEYGTSTWGEITVSTADRPACSSSAQARGICEANDQSVADILYAYGQFGGEWAAGCRLTSARRPVCAVMAPTPAYTQALGPIQCSRNDRDGRLIEVSWFQQCGDTHVGGAEFGPNGDFWRACEPGDLDMVCRDRFRLEVRKDGLKLYVNGALYFEDSGWPAAYQIPDSVIAGDWYAYQSNWQHRSGSRAFRYHWDHFAVNPPSGPTPGDHFR